MQFSIYIWNKNYTHLWYISATILGRQTHSPLALSAIFVFDSPNNKRRILNLGETAILQEEINDFISALRENGILVAALYNHWLFDGPRLVYIHF